MRYFLEVSYKGTRYAGFQIQQNANTIQGELERVMTTVLRSKVNLTGSSRTDAGVHALQNFFHFDVDFLFDPAWLYNLNSLLPRDIVVTSVFPVSPDAHCRFSAISREYHYFISAKKNPFLLETAWFYPYSVQEDLLNKAAKIVARYSNFTAFSKRNTGVKTHQCTIFNSCWINKGDCLVYEVKANRFLRGMVRGLVGTMLLAGRKKISMSAFEAIIKAGDCTKVDFSTPAHGLFLHKVEFPGIEKPGVKDI